jgi:molecular chaperone GrpE
MNDHDIPTSDDVQAEAGGPPPETAATEGETAPLNANDELTQTQKQRDDYFEQLQRNRAEFANFQKRARAQAEADRLYAVGSLARDLLDGLDNLERGAESLKATAPAGVVDGLTMIHKQLLATLAKHGIEPIEALGAPFDPNQHEALMQQPVADKPEGTVVAELGKGYKLHDRVLRPSKVAVSVKPTAS